MSNNRSTKPTPAERKRRSVPLTPAEHKALKKFISSQFTETDAAELLGIQRTTMLRIALVGSGHSDSIAKIREALTVTTA